MRVQGPGFRVVEGFRVEDSCFSISGTAYGLRVQRLIGVRGFGCRMEGSVFRVWSGLY